MNTDMDEKLLAQLAIETAQNRQRRTPDNQATPAEKTAALRDYEKQLYGPYPDGNRHERRRAAKLNRQR